MIGELLERDVCSVEDFAPLALGRLRRYLPCDEAILATAGPGFLDEAPAYLRPMLAEPTRFDPHAVRRSRVVASRFALSFIDGEVYGAAERERLPLYGELLRPARVSSLTVIALCASRTVTGFVFLARYAPATPFVQADLDAARPVVRTISVLHHALLALQTPEPLPSQATLTDRELEVAELAATGYQVEAIALHLSISKHTARHHLAAVYRKWGVGSRAELALLMRGGAQGDDPPPKPLARVLAAVGMRLAI
jgi:DNA-binding CsgD family transcriptional regulator